MSSFKRCLLKRRLLKSISTKIYPTEFEWMGLEMSDRRRKALKATEDENRRFPAAAATRGRKFRRGPKPDDLRPSG